MTAWSSSQQVPEPQNALPAGDLTNATLRQVVRVQIDAGHVRVRLSNAFGDAPLRIGAATIARSADGATSDIVAGTLKALHFGGSGSVVIPGHADYWSDPVDVDVPAGTDLTISVYFPTSPDGQTGHPGSRTTSYVLHGDHTADAGLPNASSVVHWYQLSSVETVSATGRAVVAFGDSITDGNGVQPNTNRRWTDALQERLRNTAGMRDVAVLNAGIGGNHLLTDGLGPNALARFDRDVLTHPGVTHLIVLEGVNDLGPLSRDGPTAPERHAAVVGQMLDAYRQIVARARAHGIKVIGATITPYGGSGYYHPDDASEADRQTINAWIRTPGNFDAVIDFDAALRDPGQPRRLRGIYDNDGLHPSIAGYQAMANAVPLKLLR